MEPSAKEDMDESFSQSVYEYVATIPAGRVMTYGQIAALCGRPRAARIVGAIAHWGPEGLPWQRVVRKDGGMAGGFPGGMAAQQEILEGEGVAFGDEFVIDDVGRFLWWPHE